MSSVLTIHYNAQCRSWLKNELAFSLYLEGIDNFFVNPFSFDVISPKVLNLMKKRNSLTVAPMNSSKLVFFLGSA